MAPHLLSPSHCVFYAFMAATLAIGFWQARYTHNFETYAFGTGKLYPGVLTMSFIATFVGAGDLRMPQYFHEAGIIENIELVAYVITFLALAWFVMPKLARFTHCRTMGELIGTLYGQPIRIFASLISIGSSLLIASNQIYILRNIGIDLLEIPELQFALYMGIGLCVYMLLGGFGGVATTDVIQLVASTLLVVVVANAAISQANHQLELPNVASFIRKIGEKFPKKLILLGHPKFFHNLRKAFFWGLFPTSLLFPAYLQRMLIPKGAKEGRYMFLASAAFYPFLWALLTLIGLSALVLLPTIPQDSNSLVLSLLVKQLFPNNLVTKGFIIVGMVAILLSTIDSCVHAASVLFVNDIVTPLFPTAKKKSIVLLLLARVATVAIILGAMHLATFEHDIQRYTSFGAVALYSMFTVPLLAGIMGLQATSKAFWVSVIGFFVVPLLGLAMDIDYLQLDGQKQKYCLQNLALLGSVPSFLLANYITTGGFKMVSGSRKIAAGNTSADQSTDQSIWTCLMDWVPTLAKLQAKAATRVDLYGSAPLRLTWFVLVLFMIPTFHKGFWFIATLRAVGVLLCSALLAKELWPVTLKSYFGLYYFLTVWYCVPFVSLFPLLLNPSDSMSLTIFSIALLLLIVLVDWRSFFVLLTTGGIVAYLVYEYAYPEAFPTVAPEKWFEIGVQLLFTLLAGLLFSQRKQQRYARLTLHNRNLRHINKENQHKLVHALQHQPCVTNELGSTGPDLMAKLAEVNETLANSLQKNPDPALEAAREQLTFITMHLQELMYQVKDHMRLEVTQIATQDVITQLEELMATYPFNPKPILHMASHTSHTQLQCDANRINKLLINSIDHMQKHNPTHQPIQFVMADAELHYPLSSLKDNSKKVRALRLTFTTEAQVPRLPSLYIGMSNAAKVAPHTIGDLPDIENAQFVAAHYGAYLQQETTTGFTQAYVLPVHLRKVRPKNMDVVTPSVVHIQPTTPEALAMEKKFLHKTQQQKRPKLNLRKIEKAIVLIKKYHAHHKRKSGEPFYLHAIAVADILLDYKPSEDMLLAALLHDIVEGTSMTIGKLATLFNARVAKLVDEVGKLDRSRRQAALSKYKNLQQLTEKKNTAVLIIKLADRLHNMRTLTAHNPEKQQRIAQETQDFFVPIAKQLDLPEIAQQLEQHALASLMPTPDLDQ